MTNSIPKKKVSLRRVIHNKLVHIARHPLLYLMLIPGLFFLCIYKFWPLYGLQMAFRKYSIYAGNNPMDSIAKSPWVGTKYFVKLFNSAQFSLVLRNTLIINGLKILFLFPLPIIVAIMLNEIRRPQYKKFLQTTIYIPYFFSWVMIFGIFYSLLGSYGMLNTLIVKLGGSRIRFFTDPKIFRGLLVFTEGWRETGYNAVIYLAAIVGIDTTLYEAAKVDGANKWQQIWNITIPMLIPMIASIAAPVLIVIGVIAALIAIGVALYKNWDKIKAAAAALKNFVVRIFTSLKDGVKNIFTNIKNAMVKPIEKARDLIRGIINKIKGFFSFKFKLPHIKLPHFAINPKGWHLGDLLEGVIPSLGIDWYAKGGIFNKPKVIGVGEAGPEAVVPIDKLQTMISESNSQLVAAMITAMQAMNTGANGGEFKFVINLGGTQVATEIFKLNKQGKIIMEA